MIINLPDTDTGSIARQLVKLREQGGIVTTGRVLTLIVLAKSDDDLESIIDTVNSVSREHPSRVLVLVSGDPRLDNRLDAELRLGGDAGAAEIVVMHMAGEVGQHPSSVVTPLLLPDTPVVAWWPSEAPQVPAATAIGRIAQRRITDSLFDPHENAVYLRRTGYTPGDSDLCWSRITSWRGVLASAFDLSPHVPVTEVTVSGPSESPSVEVAAGWLADRLGVPVRRTSTGEEKIPLDAKGRPKPPVTSVVFERSDSACLRVDIESATTAVVTNGDLPPFKVALARPSRSECLAEELRHLDPDVAYGRALRGLSRIRTIGVNEAPGAAFGFEAEPGVSAK
ncbi:glucose-6-phosphate dehydrogenase assembly protein OpcA [Corynebacterium lactis]|uniref:Oxppcycle protein OpcA n=1 Tax=Corynebacterium lactis RW2-5 TaxID=1408189 RepID=A0A0K2H0C8_9CORY|nr:glucose-6-phosphate dehydrogenase assembly protein OpcA [Corynebacterium lactis]ALA67383.1 oxppcycle protein OpcA [Corynebacterium lactis RW2-5]